MKRALLVIDVQNDFASPDGALSVPGGEEVLERINALAASGDFDLVVATRDWHPPDHGSFAEHGGIWPTHCVQGTWGAELHPALDASRFDRIVDKGLERDTDGYSAFDGTDLAGWLRDRDVEAVVVVGLATDYCVRASALEAIGLGLRTTVDPQAVRGVDLRPGDSERALREVEQAGS